LKRTFATVDKSQGGEVAPVLRNTFCQGLVFGCRLLYGPSLM